MLYLIGVSHDVQEEPPKAEVLKSHAEFIACLQRAIDETNPIFLGEEHTSEHLLKIGKTSVVKALADKNKIEHRFCEPTTNERREMGCRDTKEIKFCAGMRGRDLSDEEAEAIMIASSFPLREAYWLKKLEGCRDENAIFVCGDGHIDCGSFTALLEKELIPYQVFMRGIGMDPGALARQTRAIRYLADHPELPECEEAE